MKKGLKEIVRFAPLLSLLKKHPLPNHILSHYKAKAHTYLYLPCCIGKLKNGEPVYSDLAVCRNILIAGNETEPIKRHFDSIVCSLMELQDLVNGQENIRFAVIGKNMGRFNFIEPVREQELSLERQRSEIKRLFGWCLGELDLRFRLLAQEGVRRIATYNRRVNTKREKGVDKNLPLRPLVILIPELADIVATSPDISSSGNDEATSMIMRIAQLGAGVGIFFMIATNRATRFFPAGTIRANTGTNIIFKTADEKISRWLTGDTGAERLLCNEAFLINNGIKKHLNIF